VKVIIREESNYCLVSVVLFPCIRSVQKDTIFIMLEKRVWCVRKYHKNERRVMDEDFREEKRVCCSSSSQTVFGLDGLGRQYVAGWHKLLAA
jgi:hypothetical protein